MSKLLQFTTYGVKNLKKPITISFANQTLNQGVKSFNNTKGIFGYNGAGKSAIMTSVLLYKNIVTDGNYLLQKSNTDVLSKLLNFQIKEFYFEAIFSFKENSAIKHSIKVLLNPITNLYTVRNEKIEILLGRTINDKYKTVFEKFDGVNQPIKESESSQTIINVLNSDNDNRSFLYVAVLAHINEFSKYVEQKKAYDYNEGKILDLVIDTLFISIYAIQVYLSSSDIHEEKTNLVNLYAKITKNKNILPKLLNEDEDDTISISYFPKYEKNNKKLEKFIHLFKPELIRIDLDKQEDGNMYHVRRYFVYDNNCRVSLEYESTGIKQLVRLFSYLYDCANGSIVFIDEIDANINAVYFEKLISFYQQYGKGQLCFSSHNLGAMKTLKKQGKSIVALGYENNIDVWVGKGNKSPINDYVDGYFPHSPMNIEDFDFISIFFNEE